MTRKYFERKPTKTTTDTKQNRALEQRQTDWMRRGDTTLERQWSRRRRRHWFRQRGWCAAVLLRSRLVITVVLSVTLSSFTHSFSSRIFLYRFVATEEGWRQVKRTEGPKEGIYRNRNTTIYIYICNQCWRYFIRGIYGKQKKSKHVSVSSVACSAPWGSRKKSESGFKGTTRIRFGKRVVHFSKIDIKYTGVLSRSLFNFFTQLVSIYIPLTRIFTINISIIINALIH